jgi:MFS family permease
LFLEQNPFDEKKVAVVEEVVPETPEPIDTDELLKRPELELVPPSNDQTPVQMLLSIDFWIMFVAWFVGAGSALTVTNNLASIVLSYGGEDGQQVYMVVAYAFANCTGRLSFGLLSDRFSHKAQRMTFYSVALIIMTFCQLGFSMFPLSMFYPLVICTGLGYGGMVSTMYAFISDRWGNKYYGINSSIITVASASSSYLMSTLLAASVYQSHIKGSGILCYGRKCYELTFYITTGLCLGAWMLLLVLQYRNRYLGVTRKFKSKVSPTELLTPTHEDTAVTTDAYSEAQHSAEEI